MRFRRKSVDNLVKERVPLLLTPALESFLVSHGDETFYVFALDFDLGCGCMYLSANTEERFHETLQTYQAGPSGQHYRTEAGVRSLRYSPGDWGYAAYAELELLTEDEADGVPEDDILNALSEAFAHYRTTNTFARLRKAPGFTSFVIGHDEHYTEALDRMAALSER